MLLGGVSFSSVFGQYIFNTPADVVQPSVHLEVYNNAAVEKLSGSAWPVKGIEPKKLKEPYFSPSIRSLFREEVSRQTAVLPYEEESNITYLPGEEEYRARVVRNQQSGPLEHDVPLGWPTALESNPLLWEPNQLTEHDYVYHLAPTDLLEIDGALQYHKEQPVPLEHVAKSNFPLNKLGHTLTAIRNTVYDGFGFAIVRGLDVNKFSAEDRTVVFLGLSSYIGEERGAQDRRGTMLKHIMDDERKESQDDLPLHTDVTCDVIALMTVRCSDHGGQSTIAPAWQVYNELARTKPHVIHTLAQPDWPFDTFDRDPGYLYRAPLFFANGKIIFNFSRRLLVGHPKDGRTAGVPRLSEAQAEALDAVHFAAKKYQLTTHMAEGDIRFINNLGLLHGRDGFHDGDLAAESRRHVTRIWLRNTERQWKLPPALQLTWARIFDAVERPKRWDVEPVFENNEWYGRGYRSECA